MTSTEEEKHLSEEQLEQLDRLHFIHVTGLKKSDQKGTISAEEEYHGHWYHGRNMISLVLHNGEVWVYRHKPSAQLLAEIKKIFGVTESLRGFFVPLNLLCKEDLKQRSNHPYWNYE